jgi:hypothetical protein
MFALILTRSSDRKNEREIEIERVILGPAYLFHKQLDPTIYTNAEPSRISYINIQAKVLDSLSKIL